MNRIVMDLILILIITGTVSFPLRSFYCAGDEAVLLRPSRL
jgi:hypothetical protein